MTSHQTLKAKARQAAAAAPKQDPEQAEKVTEEAKGVLKKTSKTQPVYKTQEQIGGKNIHRDKDAVISEFDDPAANKV